MAERYSGEVRIRVRWEDGLFPGMHHGGRYRCNVRSPRGRTTIFVGAPAHLTMAVDSPEAYDDTARAALAFADAEAEERRESSIVEGCAWCADLSDRYVGRSPAAAWPREPKEGGA